MNSLPTFYKSQQEGGNKNPEWNKRLQKVHNSVKYAGVF